VKDFLQKADDLREAGVKQIYCVSVTKPSVLDQWLKERAGAAVNKSIQGIADDTGAFTRMLGLNLSDPQKPQLNCHR
jgi:peroxiredoxin